MSEPLSKCERARLNKDMRKLLPPGLPHAQRRALVDEIAVAVARAKPSHDLVKAAKRDQSLTRVAKRAILRRSRHRKFNRLPLQGKAPNVRVQTFPNSRGRLRDVWKAVLLHDIQTILKKYGVTGAYWHTGQETRLTKVYRACAAVAGAPQLGELRGVWENAKDISGE
jgi:hypothetical protein